MYFEDFTVGQTFRTSDFFLSHDQMMEFSENYDPQPLHVDLDYAANGPFGQVIASGFMSLALAWKLWIEMGHHDTQGQGGIAMENVRWFAPLLPDTTVHTVVTVADLRISSKGRGIITYDLELADDGGTTLTKFTTIGLVERINR